MSLVIPTIENNPLSNLSYCKIGKGKKVHLSKRNDETLCGKYVDFSYMAVEDAGEADICSRCYKAAEKRMKENRRIAYGVMRDQELDRMTYGGQPFTKEEETAAITDAMQYADRTTNADIAILTADGFVECTPEVLESALTELVSIDSRSVYERVVNPDGIDGPMSGQFDDYDYESDNLDPAGPDYGNFDYENVGQEDEPLEDTMSQPMIVEALLSIEIDGIAVNLGWHSFVVPPLCEKSIASLYGEMHGEWKRPGEPDWDSVIIIEDSETY